MIRVLMFGMYDSTYPRNRIVQKAMRSQGMDVQICHEPMWELTRDKTRGYAGLWNRTRLVTSIVLAYLRLPWRAARMKQGFDVIWVGFPGHADMPLAWLLGKLTGRPVVFDAFISWYDSAVRDRGLFPKRSFTARLLRFFDLWSCRLADRVVLDTPEHERFFEQMFKVDCAKLLSLPVGADEAVFHPRPQPAQTPSPRRFTVLQYAEFTPLHGGEYVLDAAQRLRDTGDAQAVHFEMIGDGGPFDQALRRQAQRRGLAHITFHDYMSEQALIERIASADVCLGIFGDTPKAMRVVPNKVFQCMAMGKVVLTGDTPAVRAVLEHGRHLWLCPPADGAALADAIQTLRDRPALRQEIAEGALNQFRSAFSTDVLGRLLHGHLSKLLVQRPESAEPEAASAQPAADGPPG